ncbi:hypothetical protein PMAYCL1PPCAC_22277, partial [Pristionchus mayeri]
VHAGIKCTDMGSKHAACSDPFDVAGIRNGNRYECMKGYFLKWIDSKDAQGVRRTTNADQSDTQSMQCNRDGWQIMGTSLTGLKVIGFYCEEVTPSSGDSPCAALNVDFEDYTLKKYFTCYYGETLGYTLNGVKTVGKSKKLFCGTNASGAPEWKWSFLDGLEEAAVPLGAKMSCF